MKQPPFLPRSSSSLPSWLSNEDRPSPSLPLHRKPKLRVRTLLGHCLYRRVILWSVTGLFLLSIALTSSDAHLRNTRLLDLVDSGKSRDKSKGEPGVVFVLTAGSGTERTEARPSGDGMPDWMRFRHLGGFFVGLKALVPSNEYKPEHPRRPGEESPFPLTVSYTGLPTPTPFVPHPDYDSSEYTGQYHSVQRCYLDEEKKVPVPDIYAYTGIVQGQPEPLIGSHSLLGLRDDICFDRFGRFGPYGLGYSWEEGGLDVGLDTEGDGSEVVWQKTGKINYTTIDWGKAQARCYEANKKRFNDAYGSDGTSQSSLGGKTSSRRERQKIPRTAVVVRAYTGYHWPQHAIANFRALISELALRSGGEYEVHFLLHVRDDKEAIWADPATVQRVLDDYVPQEFHSLCTLWSEAQMRLIYPGPFGRGFLEPSSGDIHGVYRSAHMPLQYFAMNHPEYSYFWNWELDMRWLGNYYELLDRVAKWAKQQPRTGIWERSAKYYIPRYHGDWANFTALVHNETRASGRPAVMGPVSFPGRAPLRSEIRGESFLPPSCAPGADPARCGVGEEADLITLNPLFDADESGWIFSSDVTGYNTNLRIPPRRCAIVTASRLSRRLLAVMHEENWRLRHSMFTEMFPASMALHHGLKAVFAPHPVSIDREWDLAAVDRAFNGGRDHSAGGRGSPFDLRNEHNHKGTTWYYHSEFAGLLWRRWLGYAQPDGRGPDGGRFGQGALRGGKEEEERADSTGRLCLRSMLVHPIKWEHPSELE